MIFSLPQREKMIIMLSLKIIGDLKFLQFEVNLFEVRKDKEQIFLKKGPL